MMKGRAADGGGAAVTPDDIALAALQRVRSGGKDHAENGRPKVRRPQYSSAGSDSRDPQQLSQAMSNWTRGGGHEGDLLNATLRDGWPRIVGDLVAGHLQPVELNPAEHRGGSYVLVLEADTPAWEHQARYLVGTIKDQIAAEFGGRCSIASVVVRLAGRRSRRGRR